MKKLSLVIVGVLCVLTLAYATLPRGTNSPADTVQSLSAELGMALPPSARLLAVRRENGMDDWIGVKLVMQEGELAAFLSTTPVGLTDLSERYNHRLGVDAGDWDPSKAVQLKTGFAWLEQETRALYLGVAAGQDGEAVLYVVQHGI